MIDLSEKLLSQRFQQLFVLRLITISLSKYSRMLHTVRCIQYTSLSKEAKINDSYITYEFSRNSFAMLHAKEIAPLLKHENATAQLLYRLLKMFEFKCNYISRFYFVRVIFDQIKTSGLATAVRGLVQAVFVDVERENVFLKNTFQIWKIEPKRNPFLVYLNLLYI